MAVNKVIYNGETLIDLTGDTVTPDSLLVGATAHDASGQAITGTASTSSSSEARIPVAGTVTNYGCIAATVPNFTLTDGAEVLVKFVNASVWYDPDGDFPTLNVSGTGDIYIDDGVHGQQDLGLFYDMGDVVRFVYNATANRWVVRENLTTRTTYGVAQEAVTAQEAATALDAKQLYSNAVKGSAQGTTVVVDDISPVIHGVKVLNANNPSASTVTVGVSGNTYNVATVAALNQASVETDGNTVKVTTSAGATMPIVQIVNQQVATAGTYYLAGGFAHKGAVTGSSRPNEILVWVDGTVVSVTSLVNGASFSIPLYNVGAGSVITASFYASVSGGATITNYVATLSNISLAKEGQEYTVRNGGTVPSLYPNMVITAKTAGVTLAVEYNRDLNKVVERLINAIIALGGTV